MDDDDDDDDENKAYADLFFGCGHQDSGGSWRVRTFFAACEHSLRELVWMPGMDEGDEGWLLDQGESPYAMLDRETRRGIMRSKGWPGDAWDPDAAQKRSIVYFGLKRRNTGRPRASGVLYVS
ncbi:hypothetical protein PG984_014337 [Apiospora sp. TS-2023a]